MAEMVAEYLGVDPRKRTPIPIDSASKPVVPCPFRDGKCTKAQKGLAPICSVRNPKSDSLWIVCEHRLCASTPKESPLTDYQRAILGYLSDVIEPGWETSARVAVQREGKVRRKSGESNSDDSSADYLLVYLDSDGAQQHPRIKPVILEMQGGGETSNTRAMTNHVQEWEHMEAPTSEHLMKSTPISSIETNAWRRQQEQFLIKGSVATRSNGKLVFVVGSRLYDKLMGNLTTPPTNIPVDGGWTLAVLGIVEDENGIGLETSVKLAVDPARTLFTDYGSFARALTDQGQFDPELFHGEYITLDGQHITLR